MQAGPQVGKEARPLTSKESLWEQLRNPTASWATGLPQVSGGLAFQAEEQVRTKEYKIKSYDLGAT